MYIVSFFTNNGVPAIGLDIPTIDIIEVPSGTIIVNGSNMTELSNGFYFYNFTSYDYTKDYAILCDGTNVLVDSERYVVAGNENYHEDVNDVVNNNEKINRILGLIHENIYIDNTVYDENGNLISSRVRIYSSVGDVGSENGIIGTYQVIANCTEAGKFTSWSQIKI